MFSEPKCKNCGEQLRQDCSTVYMNYHPSQRRWVHDRLGAQICDPRQPGSGHAEPDFAAWVAQQFADALNAIRDEGFVLRHRREDGVYVISEPGHSDGWHDVATVDCDEETDRWSVTA